jgi:hypothetical protein
MDIVSAKNGYCRVNGFDAASCLYFFLSEPGFSELTVFPE